MGEVRVEQHDVIARVIVSNPTRRNALSLSMWQSLARNIAQLDADPQVRVIILQGEGEQAFISGADISEFAGRANAPQANAEFGAAVEAAERGLCECSKPVIAMIHGICMGGGLGVAVSCDLRYCSTNAKFRMPAARLGLGYAQSSMRRIQNVMGMPRTMELFATARVFDGHAALAVGLVHEAVDPTQLASHVESVARRVAVNAPLSLKAAKLAISNIANNSDVAGSAQSAQVHKAIADCYESADYTEGRMAFMEKREPIFKGR